MTFFALLNNVHFAIAMLGAIAFGMVGWLAVDAFLVTRDFKTISRGIGFFLLSVASILHASQFEGDVARYLEYGIYIVGLLFVIANLIAESPVDRPEFKAILVLPPIAGALMLLNGAVFAGYAIIAFLAYKQYRKEFKYALLPFIIAFVLLALSALIPLVYSDANMLSVSWICEHLLMVVGYFSLGVWVWSYLQLRIREELLLVLIGTTLFMATVVSLSFSTLLVSRIASNTADNLLVSARVVEQTIGHLSAEANARAILASREEGLGAMIQKKDFAGLDTITAKVSGSQSGGTLIVVSADGDILANSNSLSRRSDNLTEEFAITEAMEGRSSSSVGWGAIDGFAIRTTVPVVEKEKIVGVVAFSFPLDNAFVDGLKDETGLDLSIFEENKMVASTEFRKDGRTRLVGFVQNNELVNQSVFEKSEPITLTEQIESRTALTAYVPLTGGDGKVAGMLSTSKLEREIIETMNTTNRYTIVTVMIIILLLSLPLYYMARRLGEEVH